MSHGTHAVPDPGLQAERTALSWRRTALSVTVGSLIALRFGLESDDPVGLLGVAGGLLGLLWAATLWWSGRRRGRLALARMRQDTGATCPDCPPIEDRWASAHLFGAALGAVVAGVCCLVVVLLLGLR